MNESATKFDATKIAGSDRFRYGVICDAIAVHEQENTPSDDYTFTRLREMRDAIEMGHPVASRRTDDDGTPRDRRPGNTSRTGGSAAADATEPQIRLINKLMAEREIPAQVAGTFRRAMALVADNKTISKRTASDLIDFLNGLSAKPGAGPVATEKQVACIMREVARRELSPARKALADHVVAELDAGNPVDRKTASALLDVLFNAPFKPRNATGNRVTEDGMYQLADGTIYKVQFAKVGSGNLYAKRLVVDTDGDETSASFEYESGAISKITPADKMSLEAAKKFGQLYGICCRCASPLTDESSVENGIGPVCAEKM